MPTPFQYRERSRNWTVAIVAAHLAIAVIASAASAAPVTDQTLLSAASEGDNWIIAGRDYDSTRFSPLGQINPANVKRLVPKWSFSLGTLDAQQTTPLVNDGMMYLTAAHSRIYAVDAHTGRQVWGYVHPVEEGTVRKMCCDAGNKGAALYGDKVYFTTNDAHVVALKAATGEVIWDTTVGDWKMGQTMTVAPLAVKGKIIVGLSGAEFPTRLWVEALDAETGKEVWRHYTIPGEGEKGVDTWGSVGCRNARRRFDLDHRLLRPETRHAVLGHRQPKSGLGRSSSARRQPLQQFHAGAGSGNRGDEILLPVHAA